MQDLCVIIVNYNTRTLLVNAIRSLMRTIHTIKFEIIVVDNASNDDTVPVVESMFPDVRIICNKENLGFSRANNRAIRDSQSRYVLLLNSDVTVEQGTVEEIIKFMDERPDVGAAGCRLVLPDGNLDPACRRSFPTIVNSASHFLKLDKLFPRNKTLSSYNLTYLDEGSNCPVDCIVGAFMMVRRDVITQVGLLDEGFFMYGEDVDWCYRIKERNWNIWYVASATAVHHKGASGRRLRKPSYRMAVEFYRAMLIYYNKHHRQKRGLLIFAIVGVGIYALMSLALVRVFLMRCVATLAERV